jgi:serine/threonine protein kinase
LKDCLLLIDNVFSSQKKFSDVVRCLGLFTSDSGERYMVLEYLSKGSLLDFLKRPDIQAKLKTSDFIVMYSFFLFLFVSLLDHF